MKPSSLDPLFVPDFIEKALQWESMTDGISIHRIRKILAETGHLAGRSHHMHRHSRFTARIRAQKRPQFCRKFMPC